MKASSILAVRAAIVEGVGIGAVPCFLVAGDAAVTRALPDCAGLRDICLVTHPDNTKVRRVRAVMDFLAELVARENAFFEG
jgi:DNA-binding transcriptional LysR family regulator